MKIILERIEEDAKATLGRFAIDGADAGFMLEPAGPGGATGRLRIPAGLYALELKPLGTSKFDMRANALMSTAGGRHLGMIRLVDVPGRSEVLIHWGNYWSDTEACLLPGAGRMTGWDGSLAVSASRDTYQRVYPAIAAAAAAALNIDPEIEIRDIRKGT